MFSFLLLTALRVMGGGGSPVGVGVFVLLSAFICFCLRQFLLPFYYGFSYLCASSIDIPLHFVMMFGSMGIIIYIQPDFLGPIH